MIVLCGEMMEFLKELESFKAMKHVDTFDFLFLSNVVGGLNVFKLLVCLISSVVGEEGAAWLVVCEDGNF